MKFVPVMTRQFWASVASAMTLSLVACTSNGAPSSPEAPQLAGTSWMVQSIGGQAVGSGKPPTLSFSSSMGISGNGGCNGFSGQATLKGMMLAVGPIMATKMSCGPAQDKLESAFLGALRNVKHARIDGDHLELSGGSEAPGLVLSRIKN